jgi:hypothetical protein
MWRLVASIGGENVAQQSGWHLSGSQRHQLIARFAASRKRKRRNILAAAAAPSRVHHGGIAVRRNGGASSAAALAKRWRHGSNQQSASVWQ